MGGGARIVREERGVRNVDAKVEEARKRSKRGKVEPRGHGRGSRGRPDVYVCGIMD